MPVAHPVTTAFFPSNENRFVFFSSFLYTQ